MISKEDIRVIDYDESPKGNHYYFYLDMRHFVFCFVAVFENEKFLNGKLAHISNDRCPFCRTKNAHLEDCSLFMGDNQDIFRAILHSPSFRLRGLQFFPNK